MFDSLPIPAELMPQPLTEEEVEKLIDEATTVEATRWTIEDDGAAEWAMRKVAEAQYRINVDSANAAEWKRRIDAWLADRSLRDQRVVSYFTGVLREYALRVREQSKGKRKSVDLASGVVRTTKTGGRVTVEGDEAFTAWAMDAGRLDLLRIAPQAKAVQAAAVVVTVPYDVALTCGCVTHVTVSVGDTASDYEAVFGLGVGMTCPGCGEYALVGKWIATVDVVTIDGTIAPGLGISPEGVSASVSVNAS